MCFVAAKVSLLQHALAVVNCLTIDYGLFTFAKLIDSGAINDSERNQKPALLTCRAGFWRWRQLKKYSDCLFCTAVF